MNDLDKIKQLFASQDINNHKLGYILAKNTLMMSDEDIIRLIVEDWKGWYDLNELDGIVSEDNTMICYLKNIFNSHLDITIFTNQAYIDTYGLLRYSIKPNQNKEEVEDVFYKDLTIKFKELVNKTFNE